jgi:hypothetical protein
MLYSGDLVGPIPENNTLNATGKLLFVYEGEEGGGAGGDSHVRIFKRKRVSRLNLQVKTS